MSELKGILEQRIKQVEELAGDRIARLKEIGERPEDWTGKSERKPDGGYYRRMQYIHDRVKEVLDQLDRVRLDKPEEALTCISAADTKQIRQNFQKGIGAWLDVQARRASYEQLSHPFRLVQVVRRLHSDSELAPLLVSNLDSELFTACYVMLRHGDDLVPKERAVLCQRIQQELQHVCISRERAYDDLSTIWWGVVTLIQREQIPADERIALVRGVLQLSDRCKTSDQLVSQQGSAKRSFDRNGDLMSVLRSVVYCYQNAVTTRKWLEKFRNPMLAALIRELRLWGDRCAAWWFDERTKLVDETEAEQGSAYNWALDLQICQQWWSDRGCHFSKAVTLIKSGIPGDWNKSGIEGLVTSDAGFARDLELARDNVARFYSATDQTKPMVIALFGPPGAGKSSATDALLSSDKEKKIPRLVLNLTQFQTANEFFNTLGGMFDEYEKNSNGNGVQPAAIFLDEFDTPVSGGQWYPWLLTLLWDREIRRTKGDLITMFKLKPPPIIFLAASRYETFLDFKNAGLAPDEKKHKTPDLITRIDLHLDIPRSSAQDRVLITDAYTKRNASPDILARCYLAELEDNARGVMKILKGVDRNKTVTPESLLPASLKQLNLAAGIAD